MYTLLGYSDYYWNDRHEFNYENSSDILHFLDVANGIDCLDSVLLRKIRLTNYNTRKVGQQLKQIAGVAKKNGVLFPGIILQGASISALVPILPIYATKIVK